MKVDNFRYRIHEGKIIKVDELFISYTVMNPDGNLNFTRFTHSPHLEEFLTRSLEAKVISSASTELLTAKDLSPREFRNFVFITSIPWLDFTAIEHPVKEYKTADIPAVAWGKFKSLGNKMISMSFSVQAHHGFVDGHHIYLLSEELKKKLGQEIEIGPQT